MDKLDYAYLRNIQNNEKAGMGLSKLDENFYDEASEYINMLKDNSQNNPSLVSLREFENARKVFEEVVNIRIKKILLNVLQLTDAPINVTVSERDFYSKIKETVQKFKFEQFNFDQNNKKRNETGKTLKTEGFKKVKTVKDIPQYRGSDGNIYGPYKQGRSVSVPKEEADFLISNQMAE